MLRAYRNWDFPKGLVESGEDPLAAARREVQEETLIEELQFNWGDVYRETAPYSQNKVARYYVAETRTEAVTLPIRPELGRPEHNEWRWVSFEEALSLSSPRVDPIVRWAGRTIGAPAQPPATPPQAG
jgi:8-oxo-dGTP pyrophosphatase MutT (NUDIX family)